MNEGTTLCPEAISQGDAPPVCNLNNGKPCVGDPDLECDYFIGYLHESIYGDKTIAGQTIQEPKQRRWWLRLLYFMST